MRPGQRNRGGYSRRARRVGLLRLVVLVVVVVALVVVGVFVARPGKTPQVAAQRGASTSTTAATTTGASPGGFYGPINTGFLGLTMFRGNASRTYCGEGPLPQHPIVLWKFGPMSGKAIHGPLANPGSVVTWTGTGWTGQPAVAERDGKTWVIVGSYDYKIHFFDGMTGQELLPPFTGQSIMKGSITIDPDGYPLVYMGCRDGLWRVIAIDRSQPTELFHLNSHDFKPFMWNQDWDGNVLIKNDYAFVPGENGHFIILKLNRGKDADGKVTVTPKVVLDFRTWTDQELKT